MEDSLDELLELLQQEADVDIGVASTVASDLLEQHTSTQHGGLPKGKAPNKSRDFDEAYKRLVRNYFDGENSIYEMADFERRFRLPRAVFNQIYNQLYGSGCFTQHYMLDGRPGINPLVRLVACFRKIAYGDADDREDENLCLSESVLHESFEQFLSLIKQHFAKDYLNRQPTSSEKEHALKKMLLVTSQVALRHGIASISIGKTVLKLGKGNSVERRVSPLLYWKQFVILTCTFGFSFLGNQGL